MTVAELHEAHARIARLEEALRRIVRASGPDCTVEGQIAAEALYDKTVPLTDIPSRARHEEAGNDRRRTSQG